MTTYGGSHGKHPSLDFDHRLDSPFDPRGSSEILRKISDTQLRHRKRVQAGLTTATATIGLAALGSKGGAVAARKYLKPAAKGEKTAQGLERHAGNALLVGAGLGGLGGYNAASISRAESKRPNYSAHISSVKKDWSKYDEDRRLLRQHGLRGAPAGVSREQRQQIWEARARHLNRKRNRWHRASQASGVAETAGGVVAGTAGAGIVGHQLREAYSREHPEKLTAAERRVSQKVAGMHPRVAKPATKVARAAFHGKPSFALLAAGAAGTATAAASRRARIVANKKTRKYSSASGGIAAGTARRMKDYDVSKSISAFGVDHGW